MRISISEYAKIKEKARKNSAKSMANRGMSFEKIIENTNSYYDNENIGYITKIATPIKVLKIDSKGKITNGFYEKKSRLDFNGVYKGYHIDFDTKETKNKSSFPLSNIAKHQMDDMRKVSKYGGYTFILIRFMEYDEVYILSYKDLVEYVSNTNRKSISYSYFKNRKELKIEKKIKQGKIIYDYLEKLGV